MRLIFRCLRLRRLRLGRGLLRVFVGINIWWSKLDWVPTIFGIYERKSIREYKDKCLLGSCLTLSIRPGWEGLALRINVFAARIVVCRYPSDECASHWSTRGNNAEDNNQTQSPVKMSCRHTLCRRPRAVSNSSNRAIVPVVVAPVLNPIRVNTGRWTLRRTSHGITVAAIVVDVFQVEGMDVTGEVPVLGPLVPSVD